LARLICTRCRADVKSVLRCRACGALCPTSQIGSAMLSPGAFTFNVLFWWWPRYFGLLDVRRPPLPAAVVDHPPSTRRRCSSRISFVRENSTSSRYPQPTPSRLLRQRGYCWCSAGGANGTNRNPAARFCSVLSPMRYANVIPSFPKLADLYSANVRVSVVSTQDDRGRPVSDGKSSNTR